MIVSTEIKSQAFKVLQAAFSSGVSDVCFCAGARNVSFLPLLTKEKRARIYFWHDERAAAFFALGKAKQTNKPVAVITTSGTAAGELLPAAMEAYYSGLPLLLITADRPSRFQGSGAPQTAEQRHLFGVYAPFFLDVEEEDPCDLALWDQNAPAHLNVRLEEPTLPLTEETLEPFNFSLFSSNVKESDEENARIYQGRLDFQRALETMRRPFVIVGGLNPQAREAVARFLLRLRAPVFLEAISGLREDPRLRPFQIIYPEGIEERSLAAGYRIDGVIRLGGVPTFRFWRNLEEKKREIAVFSINEVPFPGISGGNMCCAPLKRFFQAYTPPCYSFDSAQKWLENDRLVWEKLLSLFEELPQAEPSLIHRLSRQLPLDSVVYLGNSLPIREWDLAAWREQKGFSVYANRGLNGIDGQIATFFGLCQPKKENWAILGDLTSLYDSNAPWIASQLSASRITIVSVHNGGGKIFERLFPYKELQTRHQVSFEPLARLWGFSYEKWTRAPDRPCASDASRRWIELRPDEQDSALFWKKLSLS